MVYFTDYFDIDEDILEEYGAFNISLINDLPLFIDPFLLFGSKKERYILIHSKILDYLGFLKQKSQKGGITEAERDSWFKFSEVKQNWLGYSVDGNGGSGLGDNFALAMSKNMHIVFDDLHAEEITTTSHLEKAGLFQIGVGKDNISDFTCNLIKEYLLEYTQEFAQKYLKASQTKEIMVNKSFFSYEMERWMPKKYLLPFYNNDYIILTPKDLLTKDDNWINSHDLKGDFISICNSIPNRQLRSEIHNYFKSKLPAPTYVGKGKNRKEKKPTKTEISYAVNETIQMFPKILNYYIKRKEENKEGAKSISQEKVKEVEIIFQQNVSELIKILINETGFYEVNPTTSLEEARKRVEFLKDIIENKDGYRLFYYKGSPIQREADLQVIYRLTWYSSPYDVNREVNNGRGPVDYIVSMGSKDKSLVEFKLASNTKLKMNLANQVKIYEKAADTNQSIKVILYFDAVELKKVTDILKELNLENDQNIILIDAGDNKQSASKVK
jgi:hypothetical protein